MEKALETTTDAAADGAAAGAPPPRPGSRAAQLERVRSIQGWGIDADPDNDPTYPMKRRNDAEHAGYAWERPPQQPEDVEVLHSNERPNLSAVFGTSTPPSGVSGIIRRAAFKYSESSYGHWLPLMLADRVGVAEGLLGDLARGHVPNVPAEMGAGVLWKHDRAKLVTGALVGAVLASAAFLYLNRDRREAGREREFPRLPG